MAKNRNKKQTKHKNKKTNEVAHPHDAAFKSVFSDKSIAKDVIEKNLPEEIIQDMDMNSLEKLDGSFIDEELKETFSDIIYNIKIKGRDTYVALLLEHKSTLDKLTIFQVARYIISLWSRIIKSGKTELPVVIPIVVYHGRHTWNYKTDIKDLIPNFETLPQYLIDRMPILKHDFVNIRGQSEEDIEKYNPLTRVAIRSFKYIFSDIDTLLEAFVISIEDLPDDMLAEDYIYIIEVMLIYFSRVNKNITEEDIIRKLKEIEGKGEKIMTILDIRERRGEERGIEIGIEKGRKEMAVKLLKRGLRIEDIAEDAELSIEEVKRLRDGILN